MNKPRKTEGVIFHFRGMQHRMTIKTNQRGVSWRFLTVLESQDSAIQRTSQHWKQENMDIGSFPNRRRLTRPRLTHSGSQKQANEKFSPPLLGVLKIPEGTTQLATFSHVKSMFFPHLTKTLHITTWLLCLCGPCIMSLRKLNKVFFFCIFKAYLGSAVVFDISGLL